MNEDINSIPAAFISFNQKREITRVNHELEEMLGYNENELNQKSLDSILTIASKVFFNTHLLPLLLLKNKASEIFISLIRKDNDHVPTIGNFSCEVKGDLIIVKAILIQVFQRKKYEDDLKKAKILAENALSNNELVNSISKKLELQAEQFDKHLTLHLVGQQNRLQFNRVLAHDFQEPIRKVLIFSDILLNKDLSSNPDENKEQIKKIIKAGKRLQNLTFLIEEFVRFDIEPSSKLVDLNVIVEEATQRAITLRGFKDFDFTKENLPVIEGYPEQLNVLFFHLINNAIQNREPKKRLSIKVAGVVVKENIFQSIKEKYNYQDHIKITIEDNGIGFNNDYKEYVFGLLKKIDPDSEGMGFGLAACKKIAENHFGTIGVESQPQVGTKFTITLPVAIYAASSG